MPCSHIICWLLLNLTGYISGRPKVCAEIFCNLKFLSCHVCVAAFRLYFFLARHIYDKELNCWLLRIASSFPTADDVHLDDIRSRHLTPTDIVAAVCRAILSLSLSRPRNYLPSDTIYLHNDPLIVACECCSIVNCVVVIWNHDGNVCIGGDTCYTFYCNTGSRQLSPRHTIITRLV